MNKYGIRKHTIEYFRTEPNTVRKMIKKLKVKDKGDNLKQWEYIASIIGLNDKEKEKVIFS